MNIALNLWASNLVTLAEDYKIIWRYVSKDMIHKRESRIQQADEVQKMPHIWHDMACLGGSSIPIERGDPEIFCGELYQLAIIPQSVFEKMSGVTAASVSVEGTCIGATPMASEFTTRGQPCANTMEYPVQAITLTYWISSRYQYFF